MSEWQLVTMPYSAYPVGTVARESWNGFTWTKTERGWKANGGDTFPRPAMSNEVMLPTSGDNHG